MARLVILEEMDELAEWSDPGKCANYVSHEVLYIEEVRISRDVVNTEVWEVFTNWLLTDSVDRSQASPSVA